jgi:hypothetical protein
VTRSRASAKAAGASHEQDQATYLAAHIDDRIERRVKNGKNDRGDLTGLKVLGNRVVVECKNYGGELHASTWIKEAETEAANDDAIAGIVIAKRRGTTKPGDQWVLMTVDSLIALTTGERPC